MSSRTLVHVLLVVIVAIAIFFFPEMRGSRARADYQQPAAQEPADPIRATPVDELAGEESLPGIAAPLGLRGRAIGLDGAGLGGIRVEAVSAAPAVEDDFFLGASLAADSLADGSFEIRSADPRDAIEVHSAQFGMIADRRIARPDQSIEALLVLAPTAPVAGRIVGGSADEFVSFHALHALPEQARKSEAESELEFTRTLRARADGSFDFGRLPCSHSSWLEINDSQGKPRRVEVSATGTLEALIDLR